MREFDPPKKPGSEPFKKPGSGPSERLLDELKSIKDLLDKDVANEEPAAAIVSDIPLLDDLVVDLQPEPPLLDIDGIFRDDHSDDNFDTEVEDHRETAGPTFQFPKFTLDVAISDDPLAEPAVETAANTLTNFPAAAPASPVSNATPAAPAAASNPTRRLRPDYNRELLIQELVDEFVPQIEAALHARLSQLDNETLQALKNSD